MKLVADRFGVKQAELQSRRRTQAIAYPRQIGMYLARQITRMSLEEIGGHFGGRDHSTVLYGVQKIVRLTKQDARTLTHVTELSLELRAHDPESP
jgi:chromosomal replication initiator protein